MTDEKISRVILMDGEECGETLEIEFDKDQNLVSFICDDGTYQSVWADQLEVALVRLGVINKKVSKK